MKTKKNPLLTTAAICLIVLATVSLGYSLARTLGLVQVMPSGMRNMQEMRGGNLPQGSDGEGQIQEGMPGNRGGRTNPPEGFDPENMPEGFEPGNAGRGNMPNQWMAPNSFLSGALSGWMGVGIYGLSLILAVVAGIGMIKAKKWAVILGIILAILLIGLNVSNLFTFINWLRFSVSLAIVLLGIVVIVLLLLPGARKDYAKKQDIFDEEDYALYYGDEENESVEGDESEETDPA